MASRVASALRSRRAHCRRNVPAGRARRCEARSCRLLGAPFHGAEIVGNDVAKARASAPDCVVSSISDVPRNRFQAAHQAAGIAVHIGLDRPAADQNRAVARIKDRARNRGLRALSATSSGTLSIVRPNVVFDVPKSSPQADMADPKRSVRLQTFERDPVISGAKRTQAFDLCSASRW